MAASDSVLAGQEEELHAESHDNNSSGSSNSDLISALPDDILTPILSLLSLKEAASTSTLSNRWKTVWKSAATVLGFEGVDETLKNAPPERRWEKGRRQSYVNWVSGVVRQLQQHNDNGASSKVSTFRVSFGLDSECNSDGDIDRWLEFAISKRVESLELCLGRNCTTIEKCYPFPQR
ncbi:unnamed protein product [Linum tenue]|uniref:F-box domain-containing protein n=1 Tax=Linum tenue TaxID=586396 RepID=A0AAV0IYQ3_9ROSI|nr:unnamed protein product [Linum tenue]